MIGKRFCSGCGKRFKNWAEVLFLPSLVCRNSKRMICALCIEEEAYKENTKFDLKFSKKLLDETHQRLEKARKNVEPGD